MANNYVWSLVVFVQRLSVIVTLACCVYITYFLFFKGKDNTMSDANITVSPKDSGYLPLPPVFDLRPYDMNNSRDIFSLTAEVSPSGVVEKTLKGELPEHLKVVGIIVAHPPQIIIEDSFLNKTFFINQGEPQDGINIVQVNRDQMIISYQGQDISVPIKRL